MPRMGLRSNLENNRPRTAPVHARLALAFCLSSVSLCPVICVGQPQSPSAESSIEHQIDVAFTQGTNSQAAEGLNRLLAEPHPSSDALMRTGIAFAQEERYPEAVRAFTRCVRDYPALFEGHYNLALAELAQDHHPEALAAIERAQPQSEEESTARVYLRGKIEAGMGRTDLAQQDLAAAFGKNPGEENYALDLGLLDLETHAYPEAERVFTQGSNLNPHSNYLLLGLALSQFMGGHATQSVDASRRVLAADPQFSPARLLLGFSLYFDGKFAEARDIAGEGLRFPDPDPYLYYLEAATLIKQHGQEHAQILDDLAAAEKGIPDCALCYVASGKVREEKNDLPAALSDLQKAVHLAPDLSEGWYHLASVYGRLGNTAEAAKAREHFQAMKVNADEREKEMMRGVVLHSLGGQGGSRQ